ncbi:MAG TPA: hypothetical protein VHV78_11675, partial [Gemmatimonadaceae bacterium]|nr:hypothetical protein [Gemmatimonadaceae bacterium]
MRASSSSFASSFSFSLPGVFFRGLSLTTALVVVVAAPAPAQMAGMPGMHHDMHQEASTPVSPAALREISSVAKAVEPLGTTTAAAAAGFAPKFGWIPTMGEHWVSIQKMTSGRQTNLDAPSNLMFSKIAGRDSLVGAAYAYITADNDTVRPSLFDGNPPWHEHPDLAPQGETIVMLHVWFVASPDGPFAGTNPNLPFWALGLAAPDSGRMHSEAFSSMVRRASLALGEVADTTSIFPTLKVRPEVNSAIAAHRDSVKAIVPELLAAQRAHDSARWDRAATKAAAQWDAM